MKKQQGFTLIELMTVISIIGVLAAISIPQYSIYRERAFKVELITFAGAYKKDVQTFFDHTGYLPYDNETAGVPPATQIRGSIVQQLSVHDGNIIVMANDKPNIKSLRLNVSIVDTHLEWAEVWEVKR